MVPVCVWTSVKTGLEHGFVKRSRKWLEDHYGDALHYRDPGRDWCKELFRE